MYRTEQEKNFQVLFNIGFNNNTDIATYMFNVNPGDGKLFTLENLSSNAITSIGATYYQTPKKISKGIYKLNKIEAITRGLQVEFEHMNSFINSIGENLLSILNQHYIPSVLNDNISTELSTVNNSHPDNPLIEYRDKLLEITDDNETFRLSLNEVLNNSSYTTNFNGAGIPTNNLITQLSALFVKYGDLLSGNTGTWYGTTSNDSFTCFLYYSSRYLNPVFVNNGAYHIAVPDASIRTHISDSLYDMFAIPYSDDLYLKVYATTINSSNKIVNFDTATAIIEQSGTSVNQADIQVLPFCPEQNIIKGKTTDGKVILDYTNYSTSLIFDRQNTAVGVVLWLQNDISSFDIPISYVPKGTKKEQSNLDLWRLCSPNFASQFEFNIAKNNGLTKFNVDMQLRPYNPYIHINPDFGGLYGQDFNDKRGLILQGDFSLPMSSNAWAQYELNNKNYQNSFNRQIESMELQNKIGLTQDIIHAAAGTVSGVAKGAAGGGVGGAIAGGVASAAAGAYGHQPSWRGGVWQPASAHVPRGGNAPLS